MTIFVLIQYYSLKVDKIDISFLFWILLFLPFPFWIFDALFKEFQRIAIARNNAIQDYLQGTLQKKIIKLEKVIGN